MPGKTDTARFWDRAARKYVAGPVKDVPGYERTLDRVSHLISGSDSVLELGCGSGATALRLAPSVRRMVATDVSSEMIAIAREKATAQACENVAFSVADVERAPGPDGAFDAVLAFNLLHLIPDRPSALAHVHRLLKPDGLFVSKTHCLSELNLFIRLSVPVLRLAGIAPYVSFFSAPELEAGITDAGFAIMSRERHGSAPNDPRIFIVARKSA